MKVYNWKIKDKKLNIEPSAAAIGNFDGVHLGHKKVLEEAKKLSTEKKLPISVLTFEPHPREFFSSEKNNFLLQTNSQKIETLRKHGIDNLINLKFDKNLSELHPEEFIEKILFKNLSLKHVFVGKDFKFGKNRKGDIDTLKNIGAKYNIVVSSISLKTLNTVSISSSKIREHLKSGNIIEANKLLGRPYKISGLVIEGDKRGRSINFPTANIKLENLIMPAFGVYSVSVKGIENKIYNGIANIGRRPTVNDRGVLLEVNIFDFNNNIYGKEISVNLLNFIRKEKKFDGIESLKTQIKNDVRVSKEFFNLQ